MGVTGERASISTACVAANGSTSFAVVAQTGPALEPPHPAEQRPQPQEGRGVSAPLANIDGGIAAVRSARPEVAADARLRGDSGAVADVQMAGRPDLSAQHHTRAERRPPREPGLGRQETI